LSRPGTALSIASKGLHKVLEGPVTLPSGRALELSDHPALLARYEIRRCGDCRPFRGHDFRAVATEALALVRAKATSAGRYMLLDRVLGVLVPSAALAVVWRTRRRTKRWQRGLGYLAASLLLTVGAWLAYLGWSFDPYQAAVLAAQCAELESASRQAPE
jgi:hypothetical protein